MTHEHDWDQAYRDTDRMWSGRANEALVAEAPKLHRGRALDVGCGEGADALWLARHGWEVTALDPSLVALERGQRAAEHSGLIVEWVAGEVGRPLPHDDFDLVSVFYVPLPKDSSAVESLASVVAPGGALLFVHHADFAPRHAHIDPATLITPDDVAERLGEGWTVLVHERRERSVAEGAGAHHHDDIVLVARRDA
ncbi:class I SAM-dependent methyltransferase [Tessaracoccus sp. Z1128]